MSQRNEGIGGNGHCSAKVRIGDINDGILYGNEEKSTKHAKQRMERMRWNEIRNPLGCTVLLHPQTQ